MLKPNYEALKNLAIGSSFERSFITRNLLVKTKRLPQDAVTVYAKERFDRYRDTAKPDGKEMSVSTHADLASSAADFVRQSGVAYQGSRYRSRSPLPDRFQSRSRLLACRHRYSCYHAIRQYFRIFKAQISKPAS